MAAETTLRDTLNTGDPNRFDAAVRDLWIGDLLAVLIAGATPTESGATITAHVCTMAAQPSNIFQVSGIGGTAGVKKLLKGPISGNNAVTPAVGQVVWDGGTKLLFNTADANTTCNLLYAKADQSDKVSYLLRSLGEIDAK